MKRRLKLSLASILALSLLIGISACSGSGASTGTAGNNAAASTVPDKDTIVVGRVYPETGALASFGKGTPFVEETAIEKINADGGIYIEEYGKKMKIEFVYADSESDTTKASEAATKLITENNVDVMIVSHTVDTVNPVSAACERYGVPCISVDAPADAWLAGGPYTYSYHAFFNTENELSCFKDAWNLIDSNKTIGLLAANDAEGIELSGAISDFAKSNGFNVVDPGRYTTGATDYTSIINALKEGDCDIICGVMITPDFSTFWKQCHQLGYVPKMCTVAKATLFAADIATLGDLGEGVISEVWWNENTPYKSSLTGQTAQDLAAMWEEEYQENAPVTCAYKHANVELLVDILTRAASLDPDKILAAAAATDLETCVGHVQYSDDHVSVMPLLTGQWVMNDHGEWVQNIIANTQIPDCPLSSSEVEILPGCTQG